MNKKGFTPLIMYGIVLAVIVLLVIAIILVVKTVSAGNTLPSYFTKTPTGCTPSKLAINIKGGVNVENSAFFETEPSIKQVSISSVTTPSLLAFEKFKIKVEAIDPLTNNRVASYTTTEAQIDKSDVYVPYQLNFFMPNNDCDNTIDNFNLEIKSTLIADDPGDVKESSIFLTFKEGKWVQ